MKSRASIPYLPFPDGQRLSGEVEWGGGEGRGEALAEVKGPRVQVQGRGNRLHSLRLRRFAVVRALTKIQEDNYHLGVPGIQQARMLENDANEKIIQSCESGMIFPRPDP